jgi:mannan endo-1,4-beta-mannosidase
MIVVVLLGSFGMGCTARAFVRVESGQFRIKDRAHRFVGVNFWQAVYLGAPAPLGDRTRLQSELDRLQRHGVTNLRILAAFEGPETAPYRVTPALMTTPGTYNDALLDGLDFLVAELGRRRMHAVIALTNFWEWSGGMAQYVSWHDGSDIPYPATHDWREFCEYATRFYDCEECQVWFRDHVKTIIERVNRYTKRRYRDDPTIFAWELANEPRYYPPSWIDDTAQYIKSLDPNHMVTTGSEGEVGGDFVMTHRGDYIDYATIHIWPQNWGWYDPTHPDTYETAEAQARDYFHRHEAVARDLRKPLVLEEFGLARDWHPLQDCHDPRSSTTLRDRFFTTMYECVLESATSGGPAGGSNLWVWSGASRPGESPVGDPPHETAGWYSVYDEDGSTLNVIQQHFVDLCSSQAKP